MSEEAIGTPARLSVDEIITTSRSETGLSDLGEEDMFEGLRVQVNALLREARLHANGIEGMRASLIGFLSNRLRIEDTFRRHPEILNEEIRGPVFIIGLPRSGTTKLQRMTAASPDLQKLPYWKILNPVPLGAVTEQSPDTRISYAEQISSMMRDVIPDFFAGHPMKPLEPDEEVFMADLVMRGWNPSYVAHIPSFDAWLGKQDFSTWYVFLRKLLQLFQWQDGSPGTAWLLKTPEHMPHMDQLFRVFPNATVVHCHRDPAVSMASLAELTVSIRRMYSSHEDRHRVGRFTLDHWSNNMATYLHQRDELAARHSFLDISYIQIASDAMAQIERMHEVAGVPLRDEARAAMLNWEGANPPGKHGEFRYQLQSVGLDEASVHAAFAVYMKRFGDLL